MFQRQNIIGTSRLESDRKTGIFNEKYIWILLLTALSARIYLSFFTYLISNDSIAFMRNARYFACGDISSGLAHDYHPLYSMIIAALYKIVPDLELSGRIVSVTFGTLTVIVFYLIGKGIFGRKISFASAILLALHPYAVRYSADIISESTYFFFFVSALGLGFFAVKNMRPLLFALTGISSALAYLTRPEGIGIFIIVISWCVFKDLFNVKIVWREKLVSIIILAVSFLVVSMPYLGYIKKETGYWHLTKKKDLSHMAGVKVEHDIPHNNKSVHTSPVGEKNNRLVVEKSGKKKNPDSGIIKQAVERNSGLKKHLSCVLNIINKYLNTFHMFLFVFLIIGIISWMRIGKVRFFGFYTIIVSALYLFVLYRLSITYIDIDGSFAYPSKRHLMPLVIPTLFYAGTGIYSTGAWMHDKFQRNKFIVGFKELLRDRWIFQLIVLLVVVSVLLPKTLKPQRYDKLGIKEVGQWIKEHSYKAGPVIMTSSIRLLYYAGVEQIAFDMCRINNIPALVKQRDIDYVVLTYREYVLFEKKLLKYIKDKKLKLIYTYPEEEAVGRDSLLLYEVLR